MALIRECQPKTIHEWEDWYFKHAHTEGKNKIKITKESIIDLGERLFEKITEVVIPEWQAAFSSLTKQDCIDYIHNLTINRTYDGFIREKSVINDSLAKEFPELEFEESSPELDHAGDIDYIAKIGANQIGFQIKPITANANFASYSLPERIKASFANFTKEFGGKVFIIFSNDGEVANVNIIDEIKAEVKRLKK